MTAISTLTRDSIAAFDNAIARFNAPGALVLEMPFKEERGRLNIWASNVGARQEASSPTSLDYRLRDAPLIRAGFIRGLERVKRLVTRIFAILIGEAPNRCLLSPTHDPDQEPQADVVTPRELDNLVASTHDAVSHLFGLSILLRRQRSCSREPDFEGLTLFEEHRSESGDISNIFDLFPKTKSTEWLARRLGNANTHRRDYFRYRQDHRASLSEAGQDIAHGDYPDSETFKQSVVATTSQESENHFAIFDDSGSISSTGTSLASACDSGELCRRIPDLLDMKVENVQLQYNQLFECPYCRTIQQVQNRYEWERHVTTDLRPYICTFKDCDGSSTLFSTQSEWFSHEITTHRKLWYCSLCPALDQGYPSATDLESHILGVHRGKVTETQARILVTAWEQPIRIFGPSSCPLCEEWEPVPSEPNARSFSKHLAGHLLKIALAALPLSIEGLEVRDHKGPFSTSNFEQGVNVSGEEGSEDEEDSEARPSPFDIVATLPTAESQSAHEDVMNARALYLHPTNAMSGGKGKIGLWICHACNIHVSYNAATTPSCLHCSHRRCTSCPQWYQ